MRTHTNLFVASGVASILFLGGGHLPVSTAMEMSILSKLSHVSIASEVFNLSWLVPTITIMIKAYSLIFITVLVRATLPRLRYDQLMSFSWKFLIPLSLINIFVSAILMSVEVF